MSSSPGAAAVVPTAGPHSPGDEGRDHPEAAGPQLWSNREHQQLPQPVRAAAHQCQVGWIIALIRTLRLFSALSQRLIAPMLTRPHPPSTPIAHLPSSRPALAFGLESFPHLLLFAYCIFTHSPILSSPGASSSSIQS